MYYSRKRRLTLAHPIFYRKCTFVSCFEFCCDSAWVCVCVCSSVTMRFACVFADLIAWFFVFSRIWFWGWLAAAAFSNFFCAQVKQVRIIVEYIFILLLLLFLFSLLSQAGSLKNILDWFYVCFLLLLYKTNLLLQKRSNIY